jgi:membrane protein YqaA with SNARE-associated domain
MTHALPHQVGRHSQTVVHHVFHLLAHLGGFGVFSLSVIDSSPLFLPFGNDLLLIAMTARRHELFVYYALMATAGSVLGTLSTDALSRKGGEKGLERTVSGRQLNYIKRRVKKDAAWALAIASLLPPPFPFTGFVAGAAALQYPRRRLLTVVLFARLARFLIEATLGVIFGRRLLRLARSPVLIYFVVVLIIISVAVSAVAVVTWFRSSKVAAVRPDA